jgi:acyl-CoA thioester hydrolase
MDRVKIQFPDTQAIIKVTIPVRIGDLNYGNHVGNDAILSIVHEARMQLLSSAGFTEMNVGGHGMIMADTMIAYKGEGFYGDLFEVEIFAKNITPFSFDLLYRIVTIRDNELRQIAHIKTGMVCFDYQKRTKTLMSSSLKEFLTRYS